MKVLRAFCCVTVFALAATAQPQPDVDIDDFIAVSNSVRKAAMTRWWGAEQVPYSLRSKETFEQLRFVFDMMKPLATSKVEVICFKGLGFGPESLVYWMTDEAVYKMTFSREIFMEREILTFNSGKEHRPRFKYNLPISKTVRTKTFDAELEAFESVPLKANIGFAIDAPIGFYVRRTPDGTFESIFFPHVTRWHQFPIPDDADEQHAEVLRKFNEMQSANKMAVFARLLETLGELMEKPVTWAGDGTPRTVVK